MILIVDDDSSVRLSIGLALKRAGFDTAEASSEDEALVAVRRPEVDFVILDMNLTLTTTGRQGIDMLRKIRILRPEVPVILITAWGSIPLAVEGMAYGATDFVTKPWSNADLIAKIRDARRKADARAADGENFDTLETIERKAVADALRRCDGNLSLAAAQLGITRQALYRRIEKYGIPQV